jgi:prophage regulatory protein
MNTTTHSASVSRHVLRLPEVLSRTGLSRSTILAKGNSTHRGFDPHFPQKIKLGMRAVGWLADEVNCWIDAQKKIAQEKSSQRI